MSEKERWRVSVLGRVAGIVIILGWLALSLEVTLGGNKTPGAGASPTVLLWIVTIVIVVGVWRYAFVPYVEATEVELVARNAFTTKHIPWAEIKTIKPGTLGLVIITTHDRVLPDHAWAVPKGRGARWTKTHTRADTVAETLMARVRAAPSEKPG
jgi:hypothetical protein